MPASCYFMLSEEMTSSSRSWLPLIQEIRCPTSHRFSSAWCPQMWWDYNTEHSETSGRLYYLQNECLINEIDYCLQRAHIPLGFPRASLEVFEGGENPLMFVVLLSMCVSPSSFFQKTMETGQPSCISAPPDSWLPWHKPVTRLSIKFCNQWEREK